MKNLFILLLLTSLAITSVHAGWATKDNDLEYLVEILEEAENIAREDYEKAVKLTNQAESFALSRDNDFYLGRVYISQGFIRHANGLKDAAIVFYLKCEDALKDVDMEAASRIRIKNYQNIGLIFHDHFKYEEAVSFFHKAETAKDFHLFQDLLIRSKYYQARSMKMIEQYTEAMDLLHDASKIAISENDIKYLIKINSQLGLLFSSVGDYDNAIKHHFKIFRFRSEVGFEKHAAKAYHNVASAYIEKGDLVKAEDYYKRSIEIYHDINYNGASLFLSNLELGDLYMKQNKLKLADKFFNDALQNKVDIEADPDKFKIYKLMADLSVKQNLQDQFLTFNKKYTLALESSVLENQEAKQAKEQYNLELVTARYHEIKKAEEREERLITAGVYASVFVLLSLLVYFTLARLRAIRNKRLLEKELKEAILDINLDDL